MRHKQHAIGSEKGADATMHLKYRSVLALTAVLCLLPAAAVAQEGRTNTLSPKAVGPTPQTPDGHPDLTGFWNGLGDNLWVYRTNV